ncbi:unnamed protein product [Owenia fusiformis]|uniref:HAT C-terminal dimerisation domain-containing protein n=1 Tax=Owenia fusiformis TaxID=6347 RepID=A0A8S4NXJ1_OWEFU|nr:unnamed protein product [Owenia fusiformis]
MIGVVDAQTSPQLAGLLHMARDQPYRDIVLTDNRDQPRDAFMRQRAAFLQALVAEIDGRFPTDALDAITALDLILNPKKWGREHDVQRHLTYLAEAFGLDRVLMAQEWPMVKNRLHQHNLEGTKFSEFAKNLVDEADLYPVFGKLAEIALLIPLNSACAERGFSAQNHIKSKGRASIG